MRPPDSGYTTWEKLVPLGNNRLIYEKKTPVQLIRLFKNDSNYWMSLNGEMQFHTGECYISHRQMCVRPLQLLGRRPESVLIIGGGDGLPTQELLRHIPRFTQVELDKSLINFTKTHPVMRKISKDSFNNPRVNLIAGDGMKYLLESDDEDYDLIIDDCDYSISNQPGTNQPGKEEVKRYWNYKDALISKLTPGGISVFMEPVIWPWRGFWAPNHPVIPNSWYLNKARQWKSGSITERKRFLKKTTAENIRDWKEYTPFIHSELVELPFIGPEHYLYLSNQPIKVS